MKKQHNHLKNKNAELLMLAQLTELCNMIVLLGIAVSHISSYCIFVHNCC